jgi:hypothetical protein
MRLQSMLVDVQNDDPFSPVYCPAALSHECRNQLNEPL